jgi:hypothetical protein
MAAAEKSFEYRAPEHCVCDAIACKRESKGSEIQVADNNRSRATHTLHALQPCAREKNDRIGGTIGIITWLQELVAVNQQLQRKSQIVTIVCQQSGLRNTCGMRWEKASVSASNSSGTRALISTQCFSLSSAVNSISNFYGSIKKELKSSWCEGNAAPARKQAIRRRN